MTTDDLRTRAREAAEEWAFEQGMFPLTTTEKRTFVRGALWHAAQQPTREQIARALALTDDYDGCFERVGTDEECSFDREDCEFWLKRADVVLALYENGGDL